ncbi:MAG: hypothetical protein KAW14_12220 [Candidatus Aegiribacteria sp.]|nr:hypothetical protein [Candidatus Aegiribacteria sp.]
MFRIDCLFLVILLIFLSFPQETLAIDPPHWNPCWPMFYNSTILEQCGKGYGDWCPVSEGPHPGVDFDATNNNNDILAPFDLPGYSGDVVEDDQWEYGYMMCFIQNMNEDYGWGIGHLEIADPTISPFRYNDPIPLRSPIVPAIGPSGPHVWKHIHLAWIETLDPDPTSPFVGYFNPFDYLQAPYNYDFVFFRPIPYVESLNSGSGIWFTSDGVEDPNAFPGNIDEFQDIVWSIVDMVVYPRSSWYDNIIATGAGVRSVSHLLKRQNLYSEQYSEFQSSLYGPRTLVSFDGEIPYGPSPEYNALFFDDAGLGDWSFRTSYIITNCGVDDIGPDGLDNIWTSAMEHNWSENKFNLGGWDTRLRDPGLGGSQTNPISLVNEHAAFPDGRYAVEVTAESHATGDSGARNLPAVEISPSLRATPIYGVYSLITSSQVSKR